MKLKNKLFLIFCIMIILPIVLLGIVVMFWFSLQKNNILKTYEVEDSEMLVNFYSPIILFGQVTNGIYDDIKAQAIENPKKFNNRTYLKELQDSLNQKLSSLIVFKDEEILCNYTSYSREQLIEVIPNFSNDNEYFQDIGFYKGDEYQCLIKQLIFSDASGSVYRVYIVTSVSQIIPQIKIFAVQIVCSIVLVLIITGIILHIWIYRSIVSPLNKLKFATNNIKEGNFDFEMPKVSDNEIGEVCNDFDEMRRILKTTSEEKVRSDIEEKELIRNISHDLKTPLTAIKGYVEGLRDGVADTPEKQKKYIMTINNKVNDMDRLIEELITYSRLDTNRIPYTFVKVDASEYFCDCCEEIGVELEAEQIALKYYNHIKKKVRVRLDPEQIKRVVNNIISNSVKYMKPGRPGKIQIDIYEETDYVHVVFRDNGIGIASKDLERIFERFYRTDVSRNSSRGGSGIGLAIVKKIVEDHKGRIWAESVVGEGTTMHLNLPKLEPERRIQYEQNINC